MQSDKNFERFTDRSRTVIQLAKEEAQRSGHDYVATEHLLLGLIAEEQGVAAHILKHFGVDQNIVRREVESIIQSRPNSNVTRDLPCTPYFKRIIELAIEESHVLNLSYVGTEHLLLGLVRENQALASRVLTNLGLSLPAIREFTLQLLGHANSLVEPYIVLRRNGESESFK